MDPMSHFCYNRAVFGDLNYFCKLLIYQVTKRLQTDQCTALRLFFNNAVFHQLLPNSYLLDVSTYSYIVRTMIKLTR